VDWIRTIRWARWILPIVAMALFFVAADFVRAERSMPLAFLAFILASVGLGFDLWVRSSPGKPIPMTRLSKHPLLVNTLFFATMAALLATLIRFNFFFDPRWNWLRKTFSIALPLILLLSYNLLLSYIRGLRAEGKKSTDS